MFGDSTILRLILSQVFSIYLMLLMVPLKEPQKRNTLIVLLGTVLITFMNALVIINFGIEFYIRFYFLTLMVPYIVIFSLLAFYKNAKFIFALLSIQIINNVTIINGLFASYLFFGENTPFIDTIARALTYILFLPIVIKYIRPTYLKMAEMLNKGWWILNSALILSYLLAYFVLFVPDDIFKRPEYFAHAYIGIMLSLLIYAIIFFLFIEIKTKIDIEHDKELLSSQVSSLAAQSEEITTIAYKDALTGVYNRYSLYRQMDIFIQSNQSFLVVFIDLDNLKEINDTYDHTKGDYYLKQFALAVQEAIKDFGKVYRFAGDEFVCLITHNFAQFDSEVFKNNVIKEMVIDIPFQGLSMGLSLYPQDGLNSDDLISLADQAMYAKKNAKKAHR